MNYSPFGSVPVPKKKRTIFNESHSVSGTFPLSKVCPVCFIDSLPGSSWNINVHNLTKLETLIAPAMQRVDASVLWFKMPKRLVFKHFKKWYSGGEDGKDEHQKPHIFISELIYFLQSDFRDLTTSQALELTNMLFGPGSLWSYIGLPVPITYNSVTGVWEVINYEYMDGLSEHVDDSDFLDVMPLMAYNYLYDTYFRDQTLSDPIFTEAEEGIFIINRGVKLEFGALKYFVGPAEKTPSGYTNIPTSGKDLSEGGKIGSADFICMMFLFNRAWRKDYYTSALPTPQRGPEVTLSVLEGTAPVTIPSQEMVYGAQTSGDGAIGFRTESPVTNLDSVELVNNGSNRNYMRTTADEITVEALEGDTSALSGTADLSGLSPITIVAMRNLFKLQSFLEKNNIAGGRYIESILAHWGERVPDFTVQRPQFVRATSLPVQIMEVTATANSSGVNSLVGDQAGRARTQGNLGFVHMYTQEPSFIFGLYCVTAPPAYAGQGIPRIFQHQTRFDEPWPDFQHIGEQAIKTRELWFDWADADLNDGDFGYQQRYSEYKYMPDRVVGYFQTNLAFWHMARMFSTAPALNDDFVTQHLDPRIFAVQNNHPVTADFFFEIKGRLKLSKYSTPKLT